ncbi:hypothetical protein D3C75_1199870 [compost metagenome]
MKMLFGKVKKWAKIVYFLIVVLVVFALGAFMTLTITNKEALQSPYIMGFVAVSLGLLSIPGILQSFNDFFFTPSKKEHTYSGKCPHCKKLVEFTITEK